MGTNVRIGGKVGCCQGVKGRDKKIRNIPIVQVYVISVYLL